MKNSNEPGEGFNRLAAEEFFVGAFKAGEYEQHVAEQLGFIVSQILEDAVPMLASIGEELDADSFLDRAHMLFNHHELLRTGHGLLLRTDHTRVEL
jgi:hypothetical protein